MNRLVALASLCVVMCALANRALAAEQPENQQQPVATSQELFDLFGLDEAFFDQFGDTAVWDEAEKDALSRLLVRLPQIKPGDVERWSKRSDDWSEIVRNPADYQREFVRLEGRVRRVERVALSADDQERFAFASYYRCEIRASGENTTAVVLARNVPSKWQLDQSLDERASAYAVFLKSGSREEAERPELYFAADRVAWHPDTLLGRLGMDYGLFDTIEQQRPITSRERECFFQLLAAAGRADAGDLTASPADAAAALAPLMRAPEEHAGELHAFRGVARRAVKVHVNNPEDAARFGFDHYFEVVVFLELDGVLELAGQKVRSYPVVFCVRELPAGIPTGDNLAELVKGSGFVFKKWRYATELTEQHAPGTQMFSPLLIGKTVDWQPQARAVSSADAVVAVILVGVLAMLALAAWWFRGRERRLRNALASKTYALADGPSLNDLDLAADDTAPREEDE